MASSFPPPEPAGSALPPEPAGSALPPEPAGSALVTGATGFIGGRLVSALVDQGWTVRACGRRPRPDDLPAAADYRAVDLADVEDLGDLYDGVTHLFHLAGASSSKSDEEEMERSNVVGTRNLLAAA